MSPSPSPSPVAGVESSALGWRRSWSPSLGTGTPTHAIYLAQSSPTSTLAAASAKPFTPLNNRVSTTSAGSHVVATGGPGARLRAAPGTTGQIVGSVTDGTRLVATGDSAIASGRIWRKVTIAGGGPAWIDAGLLRTI